MIQQRKAFLSTFLRELGDDLEAHANGDPFEPDAPEMDAMLLREAAAYIDLLEDILTKIAKSIGNCA